MRFAQLIAALVCTTAAAAVSPQSGDVQVDGSKVHYTNYGSGDSAVVLVHGWSSDESVWRDIAPAIAENIRVITVDLPGHGQSDKPRIAYTMDLYARALDAILTDAKARTAILIGHSNGTIAVRQFYRKYPAKVTALGTVDGSLRPFFSAEKLQKFVDQWRGDDYAQKVGKFIDQLTEEIPEAKLRDDIKKMMLGTPQHVAISEFEATADPALWTEDPINVPLLMVLAKQPAWSAEYEQFVRKLAPQVDWQMWEGVSHFLMMQRPREFADVVIDFLQKNKLLPPR